MFHQASLVKKILSVIYIVLVAVFLASCGGGEEPTQVSTNNTPASTRAVAAPVIEELNVSESIELLPGESKLFQATVSGEGDITYEWILIGAGNLEGADSNKPQVLYTAPESIEAGSEAGVSLIARNAGGESSRGVSISIVTPQSAITTPTDTPTPPPTDDGNDESSLVIESPSEGDEVDMNITVNGSGAETALQGGANLHLIIHPHGYSYFVQELPQINDDGTWEASPVFVGQPHDAGLSFDICAVLTDQSLSRGDELNELPPDPHSCIIVKRKEVVAGVTPPTTEGAPIIESLQDGDRVNMNITVSGSGAQSGMNLYVIVYPHGYSYWVQELPKINDDGTWEVSPVFVGQSHDAGLSFDVCAVLTDLSQSLRRGQELQALPEGLASCVTVTRQ